MRFHEVTTGDGGGKGGSLGGKHDFVDVLLRRREAAIDRESAGDVGGVAFDLAAGVDQYQCVVVEQLVVADVVQHAGVRPASDDGRVGMAVSPALAEFVGQFGFQFVLGHAGTAGAHGAGMAGAGDVGGTLHDDQFGLVLDQTHGIKLGAQVVNRSRRTLAGAGLGADFVQRLGDAGIPAGVMADGVPERVAVDQQFGQFFVQLFDGKRRIETKGAFRRLRAVAVAVPDFALFMLVAAEQDGFCFLLALCADLDNDAFRLGKARQVPEIAVEAVGVVRIAITHDFRCRRDDGDAVGYGFQQALAAGDEGYVFANVNMVPEINDVDKTVAMTFYVDPGKRVYVNRINFKGNTKTRDEVLRREMRQMESSWASTSKIERSKVRLERLGYFEEVNVETPPVSGTADQIDVNYSVTERPAGNLTAGIGFSQVQGIIVNANVSQDNVFGSGKRLNLAFNNSDISTNYRFGFYDPYFTLDGVSLGYDIGYRTTDAQQANISSYLTDVANAGANFGIPLSEFNRLNFNIDLRHTSLKETGFTAREVRDFLKKEGDTFITLSPSIGWTYDTLNRAIFPTEGGQYRLSALGTVPGSDLEYYKVSYKQQQYFPIAKDLTFSLSAELAYGDGYGKTDDLPFFEHYFAGGVRSVRGFNDNTLGPRDSQGRPFGGSTKVAGSAEVFFPIPFMKDLKSVRLGTFLDVGTVSNSPSNIGGDMRYSVGISGEWLSPFGAIAVSAGKPLNLQEGDDERIFQFSFGSGF